MRSALLKELNKDNARLRRLLDDVGLDKAVLKEFKYAAIVRLLLCEHQTLVLDTASSQFRQYRPSVESFNLKLLINDLEC